MRYSATDRQVLQDIELRGEVRRSEIYEQFSRVTNACEKLVKAGILRKRTTGFQYVTIYTKA